MKNKGIIFFIITAFAFSGNTSLYAQKCDSLQNDPFVEIKNQDDFNRGFIADPLQLISGKSAGVSITKKGSDPNIPQSIFIRGISSNFSEDPLYIIDGIWDADPQFLIPDEIETFGILKDGVSKAAYGSRGMNGVIIINTKSTFGEKPLSIDFNTYMSLNTVSKRMDLLSATELRDFVKDNDLNFDDGGSNTDWQDEIFRSTLAQNYNLSLYGQIKSTGYRFSIYQRNYPGIVLGTDKNNTNLNLKINQRALKNRLNIQGNVGVRFCNSNTIPNYNDIGTDNIFYHTYRHNPTDSPYEDDGTTYSQPIRVFNYNNPLAIINYSGNESSSSVKDYSLHANYTISNELNFILKTGHSLTNSSNNSYILEEAHSTASESVESGYDYDFERFNINPGLYYNRVIDEKHRITLRGEYLSRLVINKFSDWNKSDFNEKDTTTNNKTKYNTFIVATGYEFNNKYFVNALWNMEYYSLSSSSLNLFYPDPVKRRNQYPSVSAGWKIHNEDFINRIKAINNLVFKAGFGISGNSNLHLIEPNPQIADMENLEIERMNELSIGMDYGLLDNRLTGSITYYSRNANDVLGQIQVPVPPYSRPYIYTNDFQFKNKGLEFSLNVQAVKKNRFKWTTSLVCFHNRNEFIYAQEENYIIRTGYINYLSTSSSNYTQIHQQGSPASVFYLPIYAGIASDGSSTYVSDNGGLTRDISTAKRKEMGQLSPQFELGWSNCFSFLQHFDLELSMRYIGGHSIYNATRMMMSNSYMFPSLNAIPEGITNFEEGKQQNGICDHYLEDASYLRLDYISLGYSINTDKPGLISDLRIYLSANNLLTFTNYSGLDPAYDYYGIDYFNVYPLTRSFVFGIKLSI
ncbi:MAG: TonB-dependent receptor plug domain-containing protein [Cyclobacteriaceae bacterium]